MHQFDGRNFGATPQRSCPEIVWCVQLVATVPVRYFSMISMLVITSPL